MLRDEPPANASLPNGLRGRPPARGVVRREEFYSFWLERFSQDEIQAMARAIWI